MKTTIANVHLLPTDKESTIFLSDNKDFISTMPNPCKSPNAIYIYFTLPQSDLEISKIKSGDWFIGGNEIFQCYKSHETDIEFKTSPQSVYCGVNSFWDKKSCEKVIVTTDSDLKLKEKYDTHISIKSFPLISKSFIEYFISEFNQGNMIKQIDVGLEEYGTVMKDFKDINYRLKLNRQNEISIVIPEYHDKLIESKDLEELFKQRESIEIKIKNIDCMALINYELERLDLAPEEKKYSREEVVKLCKSAYATGTRINDIDYFEWEKENLK
jgi:hypothetical protein